MVDLRFLEGSIGPGPAPVGDVPTDAEALDAYSTIVTRIAEVLARRGHVVTGSDLKESPYTRRLSEAGITVYIGHAPDQVGDADRVVISTAIPKTNPELLQARRRSIPVIPRAAALEIGRAHV